jgi:diguanylate cyclase (GGDEF)-like protein/PAS domain S-box-containing protein
MKISTRLLLLFLLVAVLPLALFSYFNLRQDEVTLRTEVLNRMSDLADKKAMQVRDYLAERTREVRTLADSKLAQQGLSGLSVVYARHRPDSEKYRQAARVLDRDIASMIEDGSLFYDVFLITPQGEIVYSYKREADLATNLLDGPYRDTQLAAAFRESRMTLGTSLSTFEFYAPSSQPAAFISAPIMRDGVFIGVAAVQLTIAKIYEVAGDRVAMGKSGETVLARRIDKQHAMYFAPVDREAELGLLKPREFEKVPYIMRQALSGTGGRDVAIDYLGVRVAAAWRYLPGLDWGMVVKIDADEVFASIYEQRIIMLQALVGLLLFAALVAYYFGRQISQPLKGLSQAVGDMAMGQLDRRADESAPGELGLFAQAFNRMVERLEDIYHTLEDRVEERTRDLNVTNEQLHEEIIEREQIEASLRDSQEHLHAALEDLHYQKFALDEHAIVAMTNVQGTITYVNRKFCEISGYSQQELIGQDHRILNSGTHPAEFFHDMYRTIEAGKTWTGEICNRAKDGRLYWVLTTIVPYLNNDGKPFQYIAIRTDITERKQYEHILQLHKKVLDVTSDGFWLTDAQGNLLMANQAYADISGYSIDELTHMHISQLEAKEQSIDEVKAHIAKIIAEGDDKFETRHRHKDGHEIDIEITTSFLRESQQFAVFARDISRRKRIENELQHNQDLLNAAQQLGHLGSWERDLLSGELRWSDEVYRIFELDPAQFKPSYENFLDVIHPDDRDRVNQAYVRSLEDMRKYDILHRLQMKDGRIKWLHEYCSNDFDVSGKPIRSVGAVQDITEQKRIEDSLRVAAVAFETHEAILITDTKSRIIRVNQAFQDITGYTAEEVIGNNPHMLSSGRQDKAFYSAMWQQLLNTGTWSGEIWDKRKDGQTYPKWLTITAVKNEAGETTEYVGIFSDITARKQAEEEIRNLAFFDSLTKLPNRRLLMDRLRLALSASARSDHYGALLFLDLDRFKTINDTLGHDYGDLLLIEVAERIKSCVREVDTVARLGGDEFVVLIEHFSSRQTEVSQKVAHIAEKIRAALSAPYRLNHHECHSSPSIGVCLYHGNSESVDNLLKHADMAMYQAKEAGRNAVRFFDPMMQLAVEARSAIEVDLRRAVVGNQLQLYYQIQIDNDNRPIGAEALVRWFHPVRGMVSPGQFIPVAEESALILEIGHWVLETACQQIETWSKREATSDLVLAINVSGQQFRQADFVDKVAAVIRAHPINASRLKLELTESVVLSDVADVVKKMHELKALGVKLSMDDFGTGYSSLSYLKQLPLDQLKIDQSFVRDIANDPNDAVMVQTIISLAKNFRLNVIAEGVETEEQLEFLRVNGCMAYQGYLFSKPVPVEEFEKLLGEV